MKKLMKRARCKLRHRKETMPETLDTGKAMLPIPASARERKCASQWFGTWAIEPRWFRAAVAAVRDGTLKPALASLDDDDEADDRMTVTKQGIAIISIEGQISKRGGSFGGASTIAIRRKLRMAAENQQVRAIMLHISSPGGTVAGTSDLADDVVAVREGKFGKAKPVYAYIADMGCSAAYWVASQCAMIYANKTALVGSIGTYAVLEDDSAYAESMGIKWRVVSTGPFKGLGADGKVTDELVADVQREVNELNAPFLAAVQAGRGDKIPDIAVVADGRAHVSEQAISFGLIDEIASLDAALQALLETLPMNSEQFRAYAAEHPDDEAVKAIRNEGYKAGWADGAKDERDRVVAILDANGPASLTDKAIRSGIDPDQVALAVAAAAEAEASAKAQAEAHAKALAEAQKEIERLRFEAEGQRGVGAGKREEKPEPAADFEQIGDPVERAEAEWKANHGECRDRFINQKTWVAFRKLELTGRVRVK